MVAVPGPPPHGQQRDAQDRPDGAGCQGVHGAAGEGVEEVLQPLPHHQQVLQPLSHLRQVLQQPHQVGKIKVGRLNLHGGHLFAKDPP